MSQKLKTAEEVQQEYQIVNSIAKRIRSLLEEILNKSNEGEHINLQLDFAGELGSGWSILDVPGIKVLGEIEYSDINLNVIVPSTVGHAGKLVFAKINTQYVLFLLGRVHQYEGYAPYKIVRMIRAIGLMGVKRIIFTNAAGGINPQLNVGSLMLISDHIPGLATPLEGAIGDFGPRHVPLGNIYNKNLRNAFHKAYADQGVGFFQRLGRTLTGMPEGVYASVPGPEFETVAQVNKLGMDGADAVGMSTTQQVTAIAQLNSRPGAEQIEVAAVSLITNIAEDGKSKISHESVLEVGKHAAKQGLELIVKVIASY